MKKVLQVLVVIVLFCPSLSLAIPLDGLVANYAFSGNSDDSSGNSLDGTVNGATLTQDRFGNANSAYFFDGVDDYIVVADDPLLNISNTITISAWVNPSSWFDYENVDDKWYYPSMIVSKAQPCNSAANYNIGLQEDGFDFWYWEGSTTTNNNINYGDKKYTTNTQPDLDQWYHYAVTYDYTTFMINTYVNGVLIGGNWLYNNPPQNTTPILTDNDLSIGASLVYCPGGDCTGYDVDDPIWLFNGSIDDIAIYNRVLSLEEIGELYNDGAAAPVPEPVPEPSTMLLVGSGLVGLAGFRKKFKK